MNAKTLIAVSLIAFTSAGIVSNASAQERTRAEVRQELIQAENDGLRLVTDTSYPEVSPLRTQQADHVQQQNDSGMGAGMPGSSASGHRTNADIADRMSSCVGPNSFCKPYFGS